MKSYFVFLSRHKLYTAIEAIGLIVSVAFIILTGNYVWQQYKLAYDHPYADRIYAVGTDEYAALSGADKFLLENELPEVEAVTRLNAGDYILGQKENSIKGNFLEVDRGFFEIFPEYSLMEGNIEEFGKGNTCIVSTEFVNVYFPGTNPIGETIKMDNDVDYRVTGVFREPETTIHKDANMLRSIVPNPVVDEQFSVVGNYMTFIKVHEGTDSSLLLQRIKAIERPHYSESWLKDFSIYTLPELYFSDKQWKLKSGNKTMLDMLIAVVLLLLVSSVINYINLNLAQTGWRAKEMATRRLHGASKGSVFIRFIFESVTFLTVCALVAVAVAYIILPILDKLFLTISNSQMQDWRYLPLHISWTPGSLAIFIGFIIVLGVTAGLIPANYASHYRPIQIVSGEFRQKNRMWFTRVFIVIQNVLTVILISLSLLLEFQLHHMMKRPLNARNENLYILQTMFRNYDAALPLIDKLSGIPGIKRIGVGFCYPGMIGTTVTLSDTELDPIQTGIMIGNRTYLDIMGLTMVSEDVTPAAGDILISETLRNVFNSTDSVIGRFLGKFSINGNVAKTLGGIYRDVPLKEPSTETESYISAFLLADDASLSYANSLLIETDKETDEIEQQILEAFDEYCRETLGHEVIPWHNDFVSRHEMKTLGPARAVVTLMEIFMGLALLISVLGLTAMSTFFSNDNAKGIAVRKVLGSDIKRELLRTIKIYMLLMVASIAVAIPLAVVLAREFLSHYAYRIENYGWIFVVAATISLIVAFLSVLWQTLQAARTNPAAELKKE